jgi:hypothetical protein
VADVQVTVFTQELVSSPAGYFDVCSPPSTNQCHDFGGVAQSYPIVVSWTVTGGEVSVSVNGQVVYQHPAEFTPGAGLAHIDCFNTHQNSTIEFGDFSYTPSS